MHLEALGKERATGGVGWHIKWYVTLIFGLFSVLFRNFRCFSCIWMHLGALEIQENTGGLSWHVQPSIMGCYFDFSAIFRLFLSFSEFQVLFTCLNALRSSRDAEEAKWLKSIFFEYFSLFLTIYFVYNN